MSSIFSDIEVSNMSLLTYGAIGITSIVLAVVTIFDKEGGPEMASVVEPEVSPDETSVAGLFSNKANPEEEASAAILPEIFSNSDSPDSPGEYLSGENVSTETAVPESQETEPPVSENQNEGTSTENEENSEQKDEQETLIGGKKRKYKSQTKKNGKSWGKKQRKRMTKTRSK